MKPMAWLGSLALVFATSSTALAQDRDDHVRQEVIQAAPVRPPPPPPGAAVGYVPRGEWVHSPGYGWTWVPAGAVAREVGGNPYAYVYTPAYGWSWYGSPWGWGGYRRGVVYGHPWAWHYPARVWYGRTWVTPRYWRR